MKKLAHCLMFLGILLLFSQFVAHAESSSSSLEKENRKFRIAIVSGDLIQINDLLAQHPELINMKTENGYTALHESVFWGQVKIIELLIGKGADVNVTDDRGKTPLYYATEKKLQAIVDILRAHGAH